MFAGIIMCIFTYLISTQMPIGAICTICQILIGIVIYIGVLLIFNDEFLKGILNKLLKRKEV